MTHEAKVHEAQTKILRELLFQKDANFVELCKVSNLENDHAKFHIKRLVELGYLDKISGRYSLSVKGKEYANKLDTDTNTIERQPKLTTIMIVQNSKTGKFIIQERLKNPYYGFMTFYSGKVQWGESVYETAVRETLEETGLVTNANDWQWRGIYHERVRHSDNNEIVEDKIFCIFYTDKYSGDLVIDFEGGRNYWMNLDEVRSNPKHYKSFEIEARAATEFIGLVESVDEYGVDDF